MMMHAPQLGGAQADEDALEVDVEDAVPTRHIVQVLQLSLVGRVGGALRRRRCWRRRSRRGGPKRGYGRFASSQASTLVALDDGVQGCGTGWARQVGWAGPDRCCCAPLRLRRVVDVG